MIVLLAFLLVMGLSWVQANVTEIARQDVQLRCHVCEEISTLSCRNPETCDRSYRYCVTAVMRLFVRFYFVSRQCSMYCPLILQDQRVAQSFTLLKPMPFLFVECCSWNLCNTHTPNITDSEWRYRDPSRAGSVCGGRARLVLGLALGSVALGCQLP